MKKKFYCLTLICLFTIFFSYGCSTVNEVSLNNAIEQEDSESAKQILKQKNAASFITSGHFTSAVVKRQKEVVEAILDAGVNVDLPDRSIDETTPLMHAVNCGYPEIAKILIERGANVNAVDKKGRSPLILASQKNPEQFFASIRISQPKSNDQLEIAKLLLNNGADSNKVTKIGTPLNFAARENDIEMIELLVDSGTDVNLKDRYGVTALMQACYQNALKVVKYLVKRRANIEARNYKGYTPLMLASGKGYTELVNYLIDNDANINSQNKYEITPLFLAASGDHKESSKLLLLNKAKLKTVAKYPFETAKSHKFIADNYPNIIQDKKVLVNYYKIASDYFNKASYDLDTKSNKLWQLSSKRPHLVYLGIEILAEDLDFFFDRYPVDVKNAIQSGFVNGFDDSKIKLIQSNLVKKIIDSNKLSIECSSVALCYKNFNSGQEIRKCINEVEE